MSTGYQNYRGRRPVGMRVAVVLLALILIAACGFIFAQRYISYTDDGSIYLDLPYFGRISLPAPPEPAPEPEDLAPPEPEVNLIIDQPPEPEEPEEPAEPEDLFGERRLVELSALPENAMALSEQLALQGANGFVYTVRDNTGKLFWNAASGQPQAVASATQEATDILSGLCQAEDVVAVARFNVLHDSYYAFANMAEAAICQAQGYVWYDNHSYHWLDPDKELARTYVAALAAECAQLGFDELLLEELCYPTRGNLYKISYANNTMSRTEALVQLLTDLRAAVEPYGTKLSLLLTEDLLLSGGDEVSGVDLSAMLPLVDGVYAQVTGVESARALIAAAVGEGEAPAFVPILTEPEGDAWCLAAQ